MAKQNLAEDLRALYEQSNSQFRFLLTWRQLLIAGYFAIFASFCAAYIWMLKNLSLGTIAVGAIGAAVSVIFYLLDFRNREVYRIASKACLEIEKEIGDPKLGYFYLYDEEEKSKIWCIRHAKLLAILYFGGGVLLLLAAILGPFIKLTSAAEAAGPLQIKIVQ